MPDFQSSKYIYKNEQLLKKDYGLNRADFINNSSELPTIWPGHNLRYDYKTLKDKWAQKILCFGDPTKEEFSKNISDPILLDDIYKGLGSFKIKMNKAILKPLKNALYEIGEWCTVKNSSGIENYKIRTVYSYAFRYEIGQLQKCSKRLEVKKWAENHKVYKMFCGKKWNTNAHFACAYYDRAFGLFDDVKKNQLSNHGFGTAIDINPPENDYHSNTWDIPAKIVQIMTKYGFYWGGYYSNGYKDAMHFEYMLDNVKTSQITYPFSSVMSDSPMKYYYNNESIETGTGGFYSLGLQRNLHGGIHLFPEKEQKNTPIKSTLPGYIVATRLPVLEKTDSSSKDIIKSTRNWPGFVLLKHTYEDKEDNSLNNIYTLCQHVISPKSYDVFDFKSTFNKVKWFKTLHLSRYGALIRTKYQSDILDNVAIGDILWVAEEVKEKATVFKIYNNEKVEEVKNDGSWLFKPAPADYSTAIEALADGKVVSFAEPFFPIEKGEVIGHINKLPEGYIAPKTFKVNDKTISLNSGFLHWEIFDIANDKSGIRNLISKLKSLNCEPEKIFNILEEDEGADNFIQLPEFKSKLAPCLPDDEKSKFEEAIDESENGDEASSTNPFNYIKYVLNVVDDSFVFAPQDKDYIKTSNPKNTYPIKLDIDLSNYPKPSTFIKAEQAMFEIALQVNKGKESLLKGELPITDTLFDSAEEKDGKKIASCIIQIPAMADILEISPKKTDVDNEMSVISKRVLDDGTSDLFENVVPRHFRNTRLTKQNEFTYEGIKKFITGAMKEVSSNVTDDEIKTACEKVNPMAWWEDDQTVVIKRNMLKSIDNNIAVSEPKAEGDLKDGEKKLHGNAENQLPVNARIDNINPITAIWLLDILTQNEKLRIISAPKKYYSEEDSAPIGWGLLDYKTDDVICVGNTIKTIIVDDDYGYDKSNKFEVFFKSDKYILSYGTFHFGNNGVSIVPFVAKMWGDWEMFVNSTDKSPQSTINTKKISIKELKFEKLTAEDLDVFSLYESGQGIFRWLLKVQKIEEEYPKENHGYTFLESTYDISDDKSWKKKCYIATKALSGEFSDTSLLSDPDNLIIKDGFIEGAKKSGKITESLTYNEYSKHYSKYDRLYGFLINELQNIRTSYATFDYGNSSEKNKKLSNYGWISLKSVSYNGYSIVITDYKWQNEKGDNKRNRDLYNQCLSNVGTKKLTNLNVVALGEDSKPIEDPKNGLIYSIALESQNNNQTIKDWKNLKSDNLEIDSNGMIKGKSLEKKLSDNFKYKEFTTLFPKMRLSIKLAIAIQILRSKEKPSMAPAKLSYDGLSCKITTSGANKYYNQLKTDSTISSLFSSYQKNSNNSITVSVEDLPENAFEAKIKCKEQIEEIAKDLQSSSKDEVFYRFGYEAVSGLDFDNPNVFDKMDDKIHEVISKKIITEDEYKKVVSIAPSKISYPVMSKVVSITKPGIKEFYPSIITMMMGDASKGFIVINAQLKGTEAYWKDKEIKLYYFSTSNNKFIAFTSVVSEGLKRTCRFNFPQVKSGNIKRKFKLKAGSFEQEFEYDFEPKLYGAKKKDSFDIEIKDDFLIISCLSTGIEPPLGLGADSDNNSADWKQTIIKSEGVGRNLKLQVTSDGMDKNEIKVLLEKIEYEIYKKSANCGFCDSSGVFKARIPVSSLKENATYNFKIEREIRELKVSISGEYKNVKPVKEQSNEEKKVDENVGSE